MCVCTYRVCDHIENVTWQLIWSHLTWHLSRPVENGMLLLRPIRLQGFYAVSTARCASWGWGVRICLSHLAFNIAFFTFGWLAPSKRKRVERAGTWIQQLFIQVFLIELAHFCTATPYCCWLTVASAGNVQCLDVKPLPPWISSTKHTVSAALPFRSGACVPMLQRSTFLQRNLDEVDVVWLRLDQELLSFKAIKNMVKIVQLSLEYKYSSTECKPFQKTPNDDAMKMYLMRCDWATVCAAACEASGKVFATSSNTIQFNLELQSHSKIDVGSCIVSPFPWESKVFSSVAKEAECFVMRVLCYVYTCEWSEACFWVFFPFLFVSSKAIIKCNPRRGFRRTPIKAASGTKHWNPSEF